jgi:hypothetical protein
LGAAFATEHTDTLRYDLLRELMNLVLEKQGD